MSLLEFLHLSTFELESIDDVKIDVFRDQVAKNLGTICDKSVHALHCGHFEAFALLMALIASAATVAPTEKTAPLISSLAAAESNKPGSLLPILDVLVEVTDRMRALSCAAVELGARGSAARSHSNMASFHLHCAHANTLGLEHTFPHALHLPAAFLSAVLGFFQGVLLPVCNASHGAATAMRGAIGAQAFPSITAVLESALSLVSGDGAEGLMALILHDIRLRNERRQHQHSRGPSSTAHSVDDINDAAAANRATIEELRSRSTILLSLELARTACSCVISACRGHAANKDLLTQHIDHSNDSSGRGAICAAILLPRDALRCRRACPSLGPVEAPLLLAASSDPYLQLLLMELLLRGHLHNHSAVSIALDAFSALCAVAGSEEQTAAQAYAGAVRAALESLRVISQSRAATANNGEAFLRALREAVAGINACRVPLVTAAHHSSQQPLAMATAAEFVLVADVLRVEGGFCLESPDIAPSANSSGIAGQKRTRDGSNARPAQQQQQQHGAGAAAVVRTPPTPLFGGDSVTVTFAHAFLVIDLCGLGAIGSGNTETILRRPPSASTTATRTSQHEHRGIAQQFLTIPYDAIRSVKIVGGGTRRFVFRLDGDLTTTHHGSATTSSCVPSAVQKEMVRAATELCARSSNGSVMTLEQLLAPRLPPSDREENANGHFIRDVALHFVVGGAALASVSSASAQRWLQRGRAAAAFVLQRAASDDHQQKIEQQPTLPSQTPEHPPNTVDNDNADTYAMRSRSASMVSRPTTAIGSASHPPSASATASCRTNATTTPPPTAAADLMATIQHHTISAEERRQRQLHVLRAHFADIQAFVDDTKREGAAARDQFLSEVGEDLSALRQRRRQFIAKVATAVETLNGGVDELRGIGTAVRSKIADAALCGSAATDTLRAEQRQRLLAIKNAVDAALDRMGALVAADCLAVTQAQHTAIQDAAAQVKQR